MATMAATPASSPLRRVNVKIHSSKSENLQVRVATPPERPHSIGTTSTTTLTLLWVLLAGVTVTSFAISKQIALHQWALPVVERDTQVVVRQWPRIIFLSKDDGKDDDHLGQYNKSKSQKFQNEMEILELSPALANSTTKIRSLRRSNSRSDCVRKEAWHSFNFMNCNTVHEIDFYSNLVQRGRSAGRIKYLQAGGTLETWILELQNTASAIGEKKETIIQPVILKTLQWIKDVDEIRIDRQRRDALISERLSGSPHVIDIYAACGMSAINEFAQLGKFGSYITRNGTNLTSRELLTFARDVALGLADLHEIDRRTRPPRPLKDGSRDDDGIIPSMVHHDFSPKNLLLTADYKIKISDFNDAQLLRWNFEKNERCSGFRWDGLCGTRVERTNRRSPEECAGDSTRFRTTERTEVHHLGSVFHFLLSGEEFPYQFKNYTPKSKKVKEMILKGMQPPLPPEVEESSDPAIQAIVQAMRGAYTFDMNKRPSARDIANTLKEEHEMIVSAS